MTDRHDRLLIRLRVLLPAVVAMALYLLAADARGQTTFDFVPPGASGLFDTGANWNPFGPPGVIDNARFNVDLTYDVLFSSSPTNDQLLINDGDVTFRPELAIPALLHTYTLNDSGVIDGGDLTLSANGGSTFFLDIVGPLDIGLSFDGAMTVQAGTSVSNTFGTIGTNAAGTGEVTVTGAGSSWTSAGIIRVGDAGTGTLTIEAGGVVDNGTSTVIIGGLVSGDGTVTVRGSGSRLDTGAFLIGDAGTGRLTIEDGGVADSAATSSRIGNAAGSHGELTVTGAGSSFTTAGLLEVGLNGTGVLTVSSGGSVTSDLTTFIGQNAGSHGTATVTGAGSTLNSVFLSVGASGTGVLDILAGGTVTSDGIGTIGASATGDGTVLVSGAGSSLNATGILFVGALGTGLLTIEAGGSVDNGISTVIIGGLVSGDGTVTVRGSGSRLDTGAFLIGDAGTGRLTIEDGGVADSAVTSSRIGNAAGSHGELTVTGAGSSFTTAGLLEVGLSGTGVLTVSSGGSVASDLTTFIGQNDGSHGTATVTGAGSTLNSVFLSVGASGTGVLDILAGGTVTSDGIGTIGASATGDGTVLVSGAGSSLNATDILFVGALGTGLLTIEAGGSVTNGTVGTDSAFIGLLAGSEGTVHVTGADSSWTNAGGLFVGGDSLGNNGGTGTLTIGPGGSVSIADVTRIYTDGQVNLQGGTLSTRTFDDQGGDFNWDSGTVNLTDPAGFTLGTGDYEFANENLVLDADQSLGVTGHLIVPVTGSLTTIGGNVNTGSAQVLNGGQMFLTGGTHDFGAGLTNNSSLTLEDTTILSPVTSPTGSDMTIVGNVTFNGLISGGGAFLGAGTARFNGGHAPGDSPAVVSVAGNLVYGGTNLLFIELAGTALGDFDRLEVAGDATLGGKLLVSLFGGFMPSFGDTFEILDVDGTLSGQFIGLSEGSLFKADGQRFAISYVGGDGNDVTITAVPEPRTSVLAILGLIVVLMKPRRMRKRG